MATENLFPEEALLGLDGAAAGPEIVEKRVRLQKDSGTHEVTHEVMVDPFDR